jgi:ATPase subunit of ABC transporter with duplicated ATPase domains
MALFEACGIHKRFGHQVVLEHIDLRFESGRRRAVTGLHSLTRR